VSLWLQSATKALILGQYDRFRNELLPVAPRPVPDSLLREVAFGERRCRGDDHLFPIRFLWLWEGSEQGLFGLKALGRSRYHPQQLLALWTRACGDPEFRAQREAEGFRFDLGEEAVEMPNGWIYVGDQFAADLVEGEKVLGHELVFPDLRPGQEYPRFRRF